MNSLPSQSGQPPCVRTTSAEDGVRRLASGILTSRGLHQTTIQNSDWLGFIFTLSHCSHTGSGCGNDQ